MDLPMFHQIDHPRRRRPAEYLAHGPQGRGWYQDAHKQHNVKRHYAFIWPKDGKNGTRWGRVKDIMKNQGPDIHVAISAEKRDYMAHRPRRPRWSQTTRLDDRGPDCSLKSPIPCVQRLREGKMYDFRTRKFRRPFMQMWTDATWPEEPNNDVMYPDTLRDSSGGWWEQHW
ncbi:hypothetical protein BDV95DRAFT_493319 [Massariosphaeria phaeospora]|uniref:Uncharacterized protein n=1 Tax=Massariosphaeria phaeospora TaxID=100035 RepID=A0A7C8MFR8_9PLEO|nr:hypothetical protein BDV95DRAFT_493319 [Massariosphaeria phaeospora]